MYKCKDCFYYRETSGRAYSKCEVAPAPIEIEDRVSICRFFKKSVEKMCKESSLGNAIEEFVKSDQLF